MLDVAIAPLLWRLDYYGIDLSSQAWLLKYAERGNFFTARVHRGLDAFREGNAQITVWREAYD